MTEESIAPLRKRRPNGTLYTRFASTEEKLRELVRLSSPEIAARCAVQDGEHQEFIPSECLVYLMRQYRSKALDFTSEIVFKTLMGRLEQCLPQAEKKTRNGEAENLYLENIRDEARHRFLSMLMKDRQEYVENLDIYEIRFEMTARKLRLDARRKVNRKEKPLESIEVTDEGELPEHVETAAAKLNDFDWRKIGESDSLLRLEEAIDSLPELQRAIIEMDRKEIPVESKIPGVVNMATVLGKTPKTIRTHRHQAYESLRAALTKGE